YASCSFMLFVDAIIWLACFFFFYDYGDLRDLHSFPTRRSSDLLIGKYVDLPMDLADASLVILAEELGHGNILSTDRRDFQAYRWKNHHPFKNLLFPED